MLVYDIEGPAQFFYHFNLDSGMLNNCFNNSIQEQVYQLNLRDVRTQKEAQVCPFIGLQLPPPTTDQRQREIPSMGKKSSPPLCAPFFSLFCGASSAANATPDATTLPHKVPLFFCYYYLFFFFFWYCKAVITSRHILKFLQRATLGLCERANHFSTK